MKGEARRKGEALVGVNWGGFEPGRQSLAAAAGLKAAKAVEESMLL